MTKLPGLTRHDDRPSIGSANGGMKQNPFKLPSVQLQPQARPVDTYSRPQAPETGGSGLMQLSEALAQISPNLQSFLADRTDKAKKDAEDKANRRLSGMSFEEARSAIDSGKMSEMDNPWFKAAAMNQIGERLAYTRVNELTKEYETNFDKDKGDLESFIRERMAGDLEKYGDSPHFVRAYNTIMNNFSVKANTIQAQHQTEQIKQDTISGVYDVFSGKARTMLGEGKSEAEVVAALRAEYSGNRELLKIDYKDQDREMVRLAESFANEGNVKMAEAILNSERTGDDGTKLGSLASNREFQNDANRILLSAKNRMENNNEEATRDRRFNFWDSARQGKLDREELTGWHKANPGAFSEAQVQSLINQSDNYNAQIAKEASEANQKLALAERAKKSETDLLTKNMETASRGMVPYLEEATVFTKTGETKTVSVDDQKKAIAKETVDRTEWLVKNGKANPDQAFDMQVESFSSNNLTNPKWENVLRSGPIAATQVTTSGGKAPAQLKDGTDLYMRLHSANPGLLEQHIKNDKTREFYESYRIATQYAGLDHEQAVQTAMMATSEIEKAPSASVKQSYEQIDEKARRVSAGGWDTWFGTIGGKHPDNSGYVSGEIARLGKFYARNGLDSDQALEEASKRFNATHTDVNGSMIYTAGRDIPKNFGEMASHAIEQYAAEFGGDEGFESSDLTIRQATNGNGWLIVDKYTQLPVENSERSNLTIRSLYELDQKRQQEKKAEIIEKQNEKQRTNPAGLYIAIEKDGSQVFINDKREIFENTAKDGRQPRWENTGKRYSKPIATGPNGETLLKGVELRGIKPEVRDATERFVRGVTGGGMKTNESSAVAIGRIGGELIGGPKTPEESFIKFGKEAEAAINKRNNSGR
ncbi:hypothetical protein [Brucella pituitosa]|uniref:Uncharacterized protein n=1 Tax=Brucella pituitosa TaxID=571256 RepID=A0A643F4P3_9HYPH|nr:hypothetical protein [Brucella pituitosa]KAB0573123.1 hypothetical protein F7Q93_01080 [Brucella pituitosa]